MFFRKYPPEYTVIAVFIAIGLVLQLTALSNSGFFSDEFLHIEAGRHPAWGYSDLPGYKICLTPIPYLSIIYSTLRLPQWRFCSAV